MPTRCCVTSPVAMQGPLLRAAVGDILEVHLLNNLSFPINIVPAGVVSSAHQAVKVAGPGETVVYAWSVPAEVRSICTIDKDEEALAVSLQRVPE